MHSSHDSWLHFPLAVAWLSLPWWIEKIEAGGHFLTVIAPYTAAVIGALQIAYLIRKHMRLGKERSSK